MTAHGSTNGHFRAPAATTWEQAYQAFETPEQELRKFIQRLKSVGADGWDRHAQVVEICSGRGSGLRAWHALGFRHVMGVDYSYALVAAHQGPGRCVLGDARALPLASASRDVAVVQGGLHHLLSIDDVGRALGEMRRVVRPGGHILIVEPWPTPFLSFVHAVSEMPIAQRMSAKIAAFHTMVENERDTYERWLSTPDQCLDLIRANVIPRIERRRWGKLIVEGSPA